MRYPCLFFESRKFLQYFISSINQSIRKSFFTFSCGGGNQIGFALFVECLCYLSNNFFLSFDSSISR